MQQLRPAISWPFCFSGIQLSAFQCRARGVLAAPTVSDNNAIQYAGNFGPYLVRLICGAGEQNGSTVRGSTRSVGLSYQKSGLNHGGTYTRKTSVAGLETGHYTVGGTYLYGKSRVSAGYARQSDQVATGGDTVTKYSWAGYQYNVTAPLQIIGAYYLTIEDHDAREQPGLTVANSNVPCDPAQRVALGLRSLV